MFREMNIIASIGYAAEEAATGNERLQWQELEDAGRNEQIERVMAIMRGEDADAERVFTATVKAILAGPNQDGMGELALEEIAKLGDFLINSGLLAREEAMQGGSIVGHAIDALTNLAAIKSFFVQEDEPSEEEAEAAKADRDHELATESEPTIQ